jgi:hypothetical protein
VIHRSFGQKQTHGMSLMRRKEMNLSGGVIIIGSLLWEDSDGRNDWRRACLKPVDERRSAPLKICYGRKSRKRDCTYTMIFSNHQTTELGRGFIVAFLKSIESFEALKEQALELAKAEGIWKREPALLANEWGAVGLLLNPEFERKDDAKAEMIRSRWTETFRQYSRQFDHSQHRVENEQPIIDECGFLKIEWIAEMNDFHFLIGTPTVPDPKRPLEEKEIAQRMIVNEYRTYFDENRKSGISTFQDEGILRWLTELAK